MAKRIVAKTGQYQKDGQTKGEYTKLGVMLNIYIKASLVLICIVKRVTLKLIKVSEANWRYDI